jgi:SAM-dependent methyltransferase
MQLLYCPACSAESITSAEQTEFASTRGLLTWHRCPKCKSYFFSQTYSAEKETAHTEKRAWGQLESALALNRHKERMFLAVLDLLLKKKPPPGRLLDIGCSFGGFLLKAQKVGYQLMGTDIVPMSTK